MQPLREYDSLSESTLGMNMAIKAMLKENEARISQLENELNRLRDQLSSQPKTSRRSKRR